MYERLKIYVYIVPVLGSGVVYKYVYPFYIGKAVIIADVHAIMGIAFIFYGGFLAVDAENFVPIFQKHLRYGFSYAS